MGKCRPIKARNTDPKMAPYVEPEPRAARDLPAQPMVPAVTKNLSPVKLWPSWSELADYYAESKLPHKPVKKQAKLTLAADHETVKQILARRKKELGL